MVLQQQLNHTLHFQAEISLVPLSISAEFYILIYLDYVLFCSCSVNQSNSLQDQ